MDSQLSRVLALFEDATPLVLKPCQTVIISGVKRTLDSKRLILNVVKFSPDPSKLIATILASFPHAEIDSNPEQTPEQWATVVASSGQYANLEQLETLAENLLKTLLLPLRRVGTKTPSNATVDPERTENLQEEAEVNDLLNRAVTRGSQPALKKLGNGTEGQPNYRRFLPDPSYCNVKLAVGRALRVCGAAEVIDYLFRKYEESRDDGAKPYLDGSSHMLDLVDISLHQIAVQWYHFLANAY